MQAVGVLKIAMNMRWFRAWGWVYRPVSIVGWVIMGCAAIFCLLVFLAIDRHSHSASDTLYGVFPYFVGTLVVLNWFASKTSGHEG